MEVFRKSRPGVTPDYYQAEAAGLAWLQVHGGPPIPDVISVSANCIEMERIATGAPGAEAARRFGNQLARMHLAGARAFGAAPPEAPRIGWIADLPMPYGEFDTFGRMFASLRIRPFVDMANASNAFTTEEVDLFTALCRALEAEVPALTAGSEEIARLHGDLWSGNLLWAPDESGVDTAWVIDPAAHGGHRESDIAMLALFGAPHFADIVDGYESVTAHADRWRERIPLHQVYPLLVHTVLFGGGYARQAVRAARSALNLAEGS